MSVLKKLGHWLALVLRPAEPGPDHHDLNLSAGSSRQHPHSDDHFNPGREKQLHELQRRNRMHGYRSGPWQQK